MVEIGVKSVCWSGLAVVGVPSNGTVFDSSLLGGTGLPGLMKMCCSFALLALRLFRAPGARLLLRLPKVLLFSGVLFSDLRRLLFRALVGGAGLLSGDG